MSSPRDDATLTKIRKVIRESPAAALVAGAILGPPLGLSPPSEDATNDE